MRGSAIEPAPRALIFDLDDTLCDYSGARECRLRIAFGKALNRSETEIDFDRLIQQSIQLQPHGTDHFADLLAPYGVDAQGAATAAEWFKANRFHGLALFPETIVVLQAVRSLSDGRDTGRARKLGIVTNGPKEVQRAKLHLLGLLPLVDFAIISEEFGVAKPDPAIFREALRLADVNALEAVVVGDSPEFDIGGAQKAGVRSIWVNRRGVAWHGIGNRPTAEIRSLSELEPLLNAHEPR